MSYIEKEALLRSIESRKLIFEESTPVEEAIAEQVSVFEEAIEEALTADVVEVVRCKDCKHFAEEMIGDDLEYICESVSGMINPVPDFYCSYGERREE